MAISKTLDSQCFALSLNSPIALRLYRYLDKKRHGENDRARYSFQIELHRLCELHLGMTRSASPPRSKVAFRTRT